ncbi:E3 ubiquitin-protein ligase tom1 [Lathyrus oleraceus]|uniref:E3 ubiquitin-protein ligase tom1 n=1 Tax=Pisum sativum TaxID=3888 RepID=A0A9D5GZN7_PEA|nr:E3 ubiquitin-protein ligase tom1 [Pisum sativum]
MHLLFPFSDWSWWNRFTDSTLSHIPFFYALCAAYSLISFIALIQLIRIELRVPEYGWTTQKIFHLFNFIVSGVFFFFFFLPYVFYFKFIPALILAFFICFELYFAVRALVFGFHARIFFLHPKVLTLVLLDLPGLVFFSTYTLLVLFWAEIYHQARSLPTDKLRIVYISVNGVMYFIQVGIWIYLWIYYNDVVDFIGKIFIGGLSFVVAIGFLIFGGRCDFCI